MNRNAYRFFGIMLIVAAVAGIIFSLIGVGVVWRVRTQVTADLLNNVGLLRTTLDATADGLTVADTSLASTRTSIAALEDTTVSVAVTINDLGPAIDSTAALLGEDLPLTIAAAQTSLESAQTSARLIDDTLGLVTAIPLFPGGRYNPEVTISDSLGDLSTTLDELPATFAEIETSLEDTSDNLDTMQSEVLALSQSIGDINTSLNDVDQVISTYQTVTADVRGQITDLESALPGALNALSWAFTLILVWLGVTQVGLLFQGIEMLERAQQMARAEAAATPEPAVTTSPSEDPAQVPPEDENEDEPEPDPENAPDADAD